MVRSLDILIPSKLSYGAVVLDDDISVIRVSKDKAGASTAVVEENKGGSRIWEWLKAAF